MDIPARYGEVSNTMHMCRMNAWQADADTIEVAISDPNGAIIGKGRGRTLGRALFGAGMDMVGRDGLDFMDAVNSTQRG